MSSKRILLVEDEPLIALDIETTLSDLGHEVLLATTLAEAMAHVEASALDVAILDYHLKEGDTTGVAARLRQGGIPFIVCSGGFGVEEFNAVFAGASVLTKPFSTDGLLDAIAGAAALAPTVNARNEALEESSS